MGQRVLLLSGLFSQHQLKLLASHRMASHGGSREQGHVLTSAEREAPLGPKWLWNSQVFHLLT